MCARESREAFPARGHDHRACVAGALGRAEAVCARRAAQLTALRRRVLEYVWESHAPVGAYGILDRLSAGGRRAAPITVYRALDFLMANGLVHRLASRNAYVGCGLPGVPHEAQFLICNSCGTVTEVQDKRIERAIIAGAEGVDFVPDAALVEVRGLCPDCTGGGTGGGERSGK